MDFVICEISGKQYKVMPKKPIAVDLQNSEEILAKVLMQSEGGKVKIGNPYLDKILKLKVLENFKDKKIRVAKFHAKANYRRVTGSRKQLSRVVWDS